MGEDCGPWSLQQPLHWQMPNLNYSGTPLHLSHQNTGPLMYLGSNTATANGALPLHPHSGVPCPLPGQANNSHGWLHCLPQYRQAFMPVVNSAFREKLPMAPNGSHKEVRIPKPVSGSAPQKRFLVFDHSGDQTTLIFSSAIGTPIPRFTSWIAKPTAANDLNGEYPGTRGNLNLNVVPSTGDEFGENNVVNSNSEMHEDTEELNALLYSDSEDDSGYTENDEVTSTGHSPGTMTTRDEEYWFEETMEEVASSDGSNRKRKLFDGSCSDPLSLMDTASASSAKHIRGLEYENDAESRCDDGTYSMAGEMGPNSGFTRMRKNRIREIVSILQNVIPGGKGKDAIVVLDEAIDYLKSLKRKAQGLELDGPNLAL